MAEILRDLHLIEAYAQTVPIDSNGVRVINTREIEKQKKWLFKKYGITEAVLRENLQYYNDDAEKFLPVYEKTLSELSKLKIEKK